MKLSGLISLMLVFFAFQSAPVFAQRTDKKTEIRRIDAYCKQIDAFVKRNKKPHLVFADISDDTENAKPEWKKFASEAELEKFRETTETYSIAYNWLKNGRIVQTNFTFFSGSGDWAHYVFHYFRPDGSLAKIEAQLNTFYGNLSVSRDFYFDRKGKLLKKTTKYLDLETQKPKKVKKGDFFDNEVTIFKRTSQLPFAGSLKKKR